MHARELSGLRRLKQQRVLSGLEKLHPQVVGITARFTSFIVSGLFHKGLVVTSGNRSLGSVTLSTTPREKAASTRQQQAGASTLQAESYD